MSHAMGLRVVAEGVSDERLRDAIARLGCDFAQGYFRVRPMPHDQHVDWWRNAPPRAQSLNARGPDAAQQVPASV
jgi:EAL domain-containing protein (putative c-di-GMP-specific phosphodiesterase class I)